MVNKTPEPAQINREREIVEWRIEGLTWRQIAERVNMSVAGAFKAYNRAMVSTL